jgi:hypothetical protein
MISIFQSLSALVSGAKAAPVRFYDSRNLTSQIHCGDVPPPNLDDLSHAELKNLVVALFEQLAELRRTNAALRDEIARLKGGPRRPNIKPSPDFQKFRETEGEGEDDAPTAMIGGSVAALTPDESCATPAGNSRRLSLTSFFSAFVQARRRLSDTPRGTPESGNWRWSSPSPASMSKA